MGLLTAAGERVRTSKLDPFKPFLREVLETDPRLCASRMFQMVRARGFSGSDVIVRRWVQEVRPPRHVRFHERLLELAGHYHFEPRPCAPYRANEKGKVERAIRYLRESFFAARCFTDVEDLNGQLERWVSEVADGRPCPTDAERNTVAMRFSDEQPRLLALPEHDFPCVGVHEVRVGKTPYVRFQGNFYSVPPRFVGQRVTVLVDPETVRMVHEHDVVGMHRRTWDHGVTVEDPAHLEGLAETKRRARELRGRDRLRMRCPSAETFIEQLAKRGSPLGAEVARLNKLLDEHGEVALEEVLRVTLEQRSRSAGTVAYLLEQRARRQGRAPVIELRLSDAVREKDVDVREHDLGTYDRLLKDDDDEHA